jgi:hypothetical protein
VEKKKSFGTLKKKLEDLEKKLEGESATPTAALAATPAAVTAASSVCP